MIGKRVFDVLVSCLGLIALSPLFFIIALLIKLETRGVIFFRQERVGQHEKLFRIHKFRTMVSDAETKGLQITVGSDSRVTRVGGFLRKYKLDELAQLIDVLLGNMSLVGPRPEVPKYVNFYPEEARKVIFSIKPGITDRASIEFKDEGKILAESSDFEYAYIHEILPIKLRYYLDYVNDRTFGGDLMIIFSTLRAILK